MGLVVSDLSDSTVAGAPSPALSGTSITMSAGHGARFPAAPFYAYTHPSGARPSRDNAEKVLVTAKATDVFTIVRAQGDTTAKSIAVGWSFYESGFDTVIEFGTADLYYNVAHYGGKGDDATDCTAAVNAAITAMPSNGGTLFFPQGTWRVGAPAATAKPVHVMGAGRNVTAIKQTNATANLFEFTGNGGGVSDLQILASVTKSAGAYVLFSAATRGNFVRDVIMSGAFRGVHVTGNAVVMHLERLDIQDCIATNGIGVFLEDGNDIFLNNVVMDKAGGTQPLAGIRVHTDGVFITDCDCIRSGNGLLVDPPAGKEVAWLFVNHCTFDTCSSVCARINPSAATSIVKGVFFSACWFSSSADKGMLLEGHASAVLNGVHIADSHFFNNNDWGLFVNKGLNVTLDDNQFSGNGIVGGTTGGFVIAAGVTKFNIRGNRSGQMANFSSTQNYGGLIDTGASDEYIVTDNDFTNNLAAGFVDGGSGTTKIVRDNLGYKTEASGTGSIASGATSAVITHGLSVTPALKDVSITLGELSTTDPGQIYVDTFTATQFTVRCRTNPGASNLDFSWRALVL